MQSNYILCEYHCEVTVFTIKLDACHIVNRIISHQSRAGQATAAGDVTSKGPQPVWYKTRDPVANLKQETSLLGPRIPFEMLAEPGL